MPVSFPGTYNTLCATGKKGQVIYTGCICPRCNKFATLYFTGKTVSRGIIWPDGINRCRFEIIPIFLARCKACGYMPRVLPSEILPYKGYSLGVIEDYLHKYLYCQDKGLRKCVEDTPLSHSTLWS
jgi:hypothetical protein